jgi:hypothetical protein
MNEMVLANRVADWTRLKMLVLDSVSSPITKRVYNLGLDEFFEGTVARRYFPERCRRFHLPSFWVYTRRASACSIAFQRGEPISRTADGRSAAVLT